MSKTINPTPTLHGEDAKNILFELDNARFDSRKEEFFKKCDKTFKSTKR